MESEKDLQRYLDDINQDIQKKVEYLTSNIGQKIKIIYHGGSQPGSVREIHIVKVDADEVRARKEGERVIKWFKTEKIEIISEHKDIDCVSTKQLKSRQKAYLLKKIQKGEKIKLVIEILPEKVGTKCCYFKGIIFKGRIDDEVFQRFYFDDFEIGKKNELIYKPK
ncbi:MAG: hypothetical protein FWG20_05060 [Candidatus Cloacimonetes bacterium]|nr:hypothetical protein [Candidatus Cloacimonadota bacterium]